ncbi:MAG: oxidoreductase [Conexibacter sp.]|nr:oxidoreductase [Conexibacter sp.]
MAAVEERVLPEVADVVIVGAGPSGAVAAKALTKAGMSVVCLEQGDWPDYSTSRAAEPDFELSAGQQWSQLPNIRQGVGDYPVEESDSDISPLIWNGVGGSTVLYAGHWMRNMPSDFRVKTLDGVAEDWPLTYEELLPYYRQTEKDFGVSGFHNDPALPGSDAYPMQNVPIGKAGRRVAKGHNELGWHWWPGSNAIATRAYGGLKPCVQRGTCLNGCRDGAKGTPDITHWPQAIRDGAHLITRATVARVETDESGRRATGVVYFDADGVERRQRGRTIILAANGVGTPRLLLNSASAAHPEGLANSSGLVGKRLMMHPFAAAVGIFDDPLETTQGAYGQLLYSLEFYETDESRGFVRGAKWNLMPTGGPIAMMRPFPWGGSDDLWGEGFHRTVGERLGHSATWGIIAEDLPDESNQVSLDPTLKDAHGIPAPKITYETSDNSTKMLEFHVERAKESLQAAGATQVVVAPQIRETGWHLLGTAKMGDNPADSVVDGYGRAHDVPNLYVMDGSTWPTSAGMNPTATIVAMTLRNVEHLIAGRRNQEVAA